MYTNKTAVMHKQWCNTKKKNNSTAISVVLPLVCRNKFINKFISMYLHMLYGLVCHNNFLEDEVCHAVEKVENHCEISVQFLYDF